MHTDPAVWRRILVPSSATFWELHIAIQSAMGWAHAHLHLFEIMPRGSRGVRRIGIPDDSGFDDEMEAGWKVPIAEALQHPGDRCGYVYDLGDDWARLIEIEAALDHGVANAEAALERMFEG